MKQCKALAVFALLAGFALAQTGGSKGSRGFGVFEAANYNYGVTSPSVKVTSGSTGTGAYSIKLSSGTITLPDGRVIAPFATTAPIKIGNGSTLETVTPSAVSGCTAGAQSGTCTITATFSYAHGQGDQVRSGTAGLQEAVNDASAQGGGQVIVDQQWTSGGGTSTMITSTATAKTNVGVADQRGIGPVWYGKSGSNYVAVLTLGATSVTAAGLTLSGNNVTLTEAAAPSGASSVDILYADSSAHRFKMINNNGSAQTVAALESPSFTTPVLGVASGTSLSLTATSAQLALGTTNVTTFSAASPSGSATVALSTKAGGFGSASPCGTTGTCTANAATSNVMVKYGSVALSSASPSVATVSGLPFTSSASYFCTATPTGNTAAIAAGGVAITYVDGGSFTLTGPNTVTTVINFVCIGT